MAKNIQVEHALEIDRPPTLIASASKQILYNLLSNAVKFTPKDGRISIECANDGDFVCISVIDTGIGIRAEDQAVVFEEFRQVEGGKDSTQEGTGWDSPSPAPRRTTRRHNLARERTRQWQPIYVYPSRSIKPNTNASATNTLSATIPQRGAAGEGRSRPLVLIVDDELPARELLASY